MAKDAKPEAAAEVAAPAPKKKKLLIIVAAVLVLLLLVGGGAAFYLFKSHAAESGDEGEATSEAKPAAKGEAKGKDGKEIAPVYAALDQFTVNLAPENGDQFLQIAISVELTDLPAAEKLKTYMPKLRNGVMVLLSGKKASELLPKSGKEALAGEIRDLINQILEPNLKPDAGPVKEVLFTSFIIQ